jgi:hypothetical protein
MQQNRQRPLDDAVTHLAIFGDGQGSAEVRTVDHSMRRAS